MAKSSEHGFSGSLCVLKMPVLGEECVQVQFSNVNQNYSWVYIITHASHPELVVLWWPSFIPLQTAVVAESAITVHYFSINNAYIKSAFSKVCVPFLESRKAMTSVIYACSCRSLLFAPWQRIAHVSPYPQSLMDGRRTGVFLAATSHKASLNPCVGWVGVSEAVNGISVVWAQHRRKHCME